MGEYKELPIPRIVVGALLHDGKGKILLCRSKKWSDQWCIVGGHLDWGETLIECVKREVWEETALEVEDVTFLGFQESIFPKEFFEQRHFLFMDFIAKARPGEITLNEEIQEYQWVTLGEAMALTLNPFTKTSIKRYLEER